MLPKYRLMVPGPTPLPPEVTAAGVLPLLDERTALFAEMFIQVTNNLQRVLLTKNDVLTFTSSMTGSFEGTIQNLFSPGDKVLIANNGYFGTRWVELCHAFGLQVVELTYQWGQPIDNQEVADHLASDPSIKGAIGILCETSSGTVSDMRGFGQATRDVLSIVDAASGLGACELRTDEWGIDVVVAGCQKALMTPPGLAFVSISKRAWKAHASAKLPRYYFDWTAAKKAFTSEFPRTPWTPAISLIVQLNAALQLMLSEGMENVFSRHVLLGKAAREGIKGMGLQLLVPDEDRSASVTTAWAPDGLDADNLVTTLLFKHGLQITGGQEALKGKIFRFGHCGYFDSYDIIVTLAAIELGLFSLGYPLELGKGVAAAQRVFSQNMGNQPLHPAWQQEVLMADNALLVE